MPCYTPPEYDLGFVMELLCKACRLLTPQEMSLISALDRENRDSDNNALKQDLYDWYKNHVIRDFKHNDDKSLAILEAQRIGLECVPE